MFARGMERSDIASRPRQAPGLEPVETAGSPKGGRGHGQQPELRGEGRAGTVTGDW